MELEGKVWKDGKFWLIEIPYLNIMTQGKTKKDAFVMILDAVNLLMTDTFEDEIFNFELNIYDSEVFGLNCNNTLLLMAFALHRQRELNKITVREEVKAQKITQLEFCKYLSNSPTAYSRYE